MLVSPIVGQFYHGKSVSVTFRGFYHEEIRNFTIEDQNQDIILDNTSVGRKKTVGLCQLGLEGFDVISVLAFVKFTVKRSGRTHPFHTWVFPL